MPAKIHSYEDFLYAKDSFYVFDDFDHYVTADTWTSLATDGGTSVAVLDGVGGKVILTSSATDNDEVAVHTTTELFLVAAHKEIRFAACVEYAEAATNAANVMIGLMNAMVADSMVDDGAGVRTTGNYFVFFKVDGGTTWNVRSRNSTATMTNDTGITAGGADPHTFEIIVEDEGNGGTNVKATYKIDGVICKDATTLRPISHAIPIASSTEMHAGVYVKAGSANDQLAYVDWIYASQKRADLLL